MVHLTEKSVLRFQELFKEKYGVNYSYEEAHEAAHNLVGYFELLLKIDEENKKN